MGHAEVAEAPGQRGGDRQRRIGHGSIGRGVVGGGEAEIAGKAAGVLHHRVKAAGLADPEEQDHDERDGHDDALNKVRRGGRQEAAHRGIEHDDDRADDHRRVIVHAEQGVEELAAGGEAGSRVGYEENNNHERGDQGQHVLLIAVAVGEELRDRDGAGGLGISAEALGHDQPVEIGARRKTDGGPAGIRDAGEIGDAGQAHQEPAAHIRGFRAHGRDQGPELSAAQVEIAHGLIFFGKLDADAHHGEKINGHGDQHRDLCSTHNHSPLLPLRPAVPPGSTRDFTILAQESVLVSYFFHRINALPWKTVGRVPLLTVDFPEEKE